MRAELETLSAIHHSSSACGYDKFDLSSIAGTDLFYSQATGGDGNNYFTVRTCGPVQGSGCGSYYQGVSQACVQASNSATYYSLGKYDPSQGWSSSPTGIRYSSNNGGVCPGQAGQTADLSIWYTCEPSRTTPAIIDVSLTSSTCTYNIYIATNLVCSS